MCDYFWQRMDQNNQGDLTDIFRNSGHTTNDTWHLLPEPAATYAPPSNIFGDPFADIGDPLLDEMAATNFFNLSDTAIVTTSSARGDDGSAQKMLLGEEGKNSIFSRMLQISPVITGKMSAEIEPSPLVATAIGDGGGGLQISSTRVQAGIKRRKSQVKKVVCIPAPAAASGRPSGTGEVVPSDLWAWRKYGQKPIKGSPYPRGYYRCSSSKGCSARKQVERSRTDPNMLVITYTSEHNHPWPTQRNALAGSTRSQSSKGNNASTSKNCPHNLNQSTNIKEEHKECSSSTIQLVKEEEAYVMEKALVDPQDHDFDQVFDESFIMSDSNQPDFFAHLAELESSDPMNLVFPKGFMGDHDKLDEERERNKALDPFNIFDWEGESSLEEAKRGL